MMRFGCCATPDQATLAAEAGFDYIEPAIGRLMSLPDDTRASVIATLRHGPLPVEAFNVFLPRGYMVVGDDVPSEPPAGLPDLETFTHQALDTVRALSGDVVVFGSGGARRIPEGFPRETAWQQLVDYTRFLGEAAAKRGLRIAIEPLNTRETNLINSVAEATDLANAVAHPAVGVLADMFHMAYDGEAFSEVDIPGNRLWHAHVAAIDRTAPLKDGDELARFFQALHQARYNGRVSIECRWDDFAAQARPALEYLRRHAG